MNQALTASLFAIALILTPLAAQAYASEVEIIEPSKTWILIIAPGCDYTDSDGLRLRLAYNNTGYEAFNKNRFEVVCMGGVDVLSIESVTLPLLRSAFPNDAFVFAYSETQKRDYQLYAVSKYPGLEVAQVPHGNADIERGYALAPVDSHPAIQHERAHLETCSAHLKGADNNDAGSWTRTAEKPWC